MIRIIRNYITGAGDSWPRAEGNLLAWMQENAPDIADKRVMIEINGHPVVDTGADKNPDAKCDVDVTGSDNVIIRVLPEGIETATLVAIGIGFLASVAVTLLMPMPRIPNDAGETKSSPNNRLNASRNEYRPRQAIPDTSGQVRSFPDFLQPPYISFADNKPRIVEWFLLGLGEHDLLEPFRSGDTDIEGLPDSTFELFQPSQHPANIEVRLGVDEAENTPIPAAQDPSRFRTVNGGSINTEANNVINVVNPDIVGDFALISGSQVRIQGDYFDLNTQQAESINEVVTVLSVSGSEITVDGIGAQSTAGSWDGSITNLAIDPQTPWFVLPDREAERVVFNIEMPRGLRGGGASQNSVLLALQRQEVDANGDPIGSLISDNEEITANTPNPIYREYEYSVSAGRYRVRVLNLSQFDTGTTAEQSVVMHSIYSGREYRTSEFGDVTIGQSIRKSNPSGSGGSDKTNGLVGRLLEIFDPSTATFGAKAHTRSFAQYVMYLHMVRGRGELRDIDYEALFDIEQSLPEPLTRFDFTFDDRDVSLGERIATACNAARVRVYTIGNYTTFVREELKPVRQALFGRRDIAPNSMREVWKPHRSSEYDSVEIEYVNPDTNAPAYERRRINSSGGIETGLGDYPNTMQLAGCRTQEQAANRADYEIRRMRYQRRSLSITALRNAQDVTPGMRVAVESINDSETFGGEILRVEGNVYYTSEKFEPLVGQVYYVYITDEMGAVSNQVPVSAVEGEPFAFEAEGLTGFVADGYEVQVGSRYVIATADDMEAQDWIVVSRAKPDEFGRVNLELVNYDERVYSED